jgi:hypothetical protein
MSIGENEWVKKGLDILGLGGAMDQLAKVKAEMEKPVTANRNAASNVANGAKAFLGIAQTPDNNNAADNITNIINAAMQGVAKGLQSLNFKDIAHQIKGGGENVKKFLDGIGKSGQDQLLALAKNPPELAKLGDEQKGAFKEVLANLANASGDFGKQVADIKTSEVAMPNLMLEAKKDVEKAQQSLQIAKAETAKASTAGAGGAGEKKETQAEKDLKVLKAQLDIMKDQASQDIEKLQRQKELSQFEEAKLKLTQASIVLDTVKSDLVEKQLKDLEAQRLVASQLDPIDTAGRLAKDDQMESIQRLLVAKREELSLAKDQERLDQNKVQGDRDMIQKQTDLSQLEIDRQIQLRKDKLDNDTRAINQKISSITINIQTLPNQSNEDIAQQVARIIGQQISQTA